MYSCYSMCSSNDDVLAREEFSEPKLCTKNGAVEVVSTKKQREIEEFTSTS